MKIEQFRFGKWEEINHTDPMYFYEDLVHTSRPFRFVECMEEEIDEYWDNIIQHSDEYFVYSRWDSRYFKHCNDSFPFIANEIYAFENYRVYEFHSLVKRYKDFAEIYQNKLDEIEREENDNGK